ncbi:hypothetical protein [Saccharothrix obliqua]|uniref:hypothetical protein n=1 Tax=Saccharothrix obliqua TaxID=2861747 RepID=UPI001C5F25F9|nr:hypothetical protein [Saccharothrix obliqua]MBW4722463.1 hypothetical protein [Saccharothrix obliqua]
MDTTHNATEAAQAVDARQDAIARAQALLGADAPFAQILRTAEFLLNGPVALDPDRLEHAARSLARSRGMAWPVTEPKAHNELLGAALNAVTAYHRG